MRMIAVINATLAGDGFEQKSLFAFNISVSFFPF